MTTDNMPTKKQRDLEARDKLRLMKEDMEALSNMVVDRLQARRSMSQEQHNIEHEWIRRKIKREQKREELWDDIKTKIAKDGAWWLVVSAFVAMGTALVVWLRQVTKG